MPECYLCKQGCPRKPSGGHGYWTELGHMSVVCPVTEEALTELETKLRDEVIPAIKERARQLAEDADA